MTVRPAKCVGTVRFPLTAIGHMRPLKNEIAPAYFVSQAAYAWTSIIGTVAFAWSFEINAKRNAVAGLPPFVMSYFFCTALRIK